MRVGLEARSLSTLGGGVRTYTLEVIKRILAADQKNEYVIFYDDKKFLGTFPKVKEIVVPLLHPLFRLFWDWIQLPLAIKKEKIEVMHYFKAALSPWKATKRQIVTIYDIIPLLYPETQTFIQRFYWKIQLPLAAKKSDLVITISENSKNDIVSRFDVPKEKVVVTPLAADERFQVMNNPQALRKVKEKYHLPEKFFLYLGTLEPRKNVPLVIKALAKLKKKDRIKLVIAGKKGWKYQEIFDLVDKLGLKNDVVFTGFVAEKDLPALYNLAFAFIFPSLYEGFGLPPLEAMACGCPVIASNTSSLPEVVKDAGILINPQKEDELYEAMNKLLINLPLREDLKQKGLLRTKKFSWNKVAEKTLQVYNEALKIRNPKFEIRNKL